MYSSLSVFFLILHFTYLQGGARGCIRTPLPRGLRTPSGQTVRRHVAVLDPEWSVAVHNLLADDGEAVDVALLRALGRRVDQPQQLGRRPQLSCISTSSVFTCIGALDNPQPNGAVTRKYYWVSLTVGLCEGEGRKLAAVIAPLLSSVL